MTYLPFHKLYTRFLSFVQNMPHSAPCFLVDIPVRPPRPPVAGLPAMVNPEPCCSLVSWRTHSPGQVASRALGEIWEGDWCAHNRGGSHRRLAVFRCKPAAERFKGQCRIKNEKCWLRTYCPWLNAEGNLLAGKKSRYEKENRRGEGASPISCRECSICQSAASVTESEILRCVLGIQS